MDAMRFQEGIRYKSGGGRQVSYLSCFYCHLSQALCAEGYRDKGRSCKYKHIVMPLALVVFIEPAMRAWMEKVVIKRALRDEKDYQQWLGQRHPQLVGGIEMTNAMAVFSWIIKQQKD
jgi:hypothetical protein